MNWEGRNVLVTGGSGFVGSNISRSLIEKGANVIVLLKSGIPDVVLNYLDVTKRLKAVVAGDITKFESTKKIFSDYEIDTCFHLAAQPIVGIANQSPIPTFETNIVGTWNIMEIARTLDCMERVVVASSDKCYGDPISLPITEDHCLLASYPYDASKACADILSRVFYKTYGMSVGVTRCCNIYGGGDLNFTRIFPDSVKSVILNKNPVIRSDGTPVRDYIYISDVVSAYLTLAENLDRDEIKGQAFNFGSNSPISVLDLVKTIIKVSGKNVQPEVLGKTKPHAEINVQYLTSDKAKKMMGWTPKVKLEDGIRETIKWYSDFFKSSFGKEFL